MHRYTFLKFTAFFSICAIFILIEMIARRYFLDNGPFVLNSGISWSIGARIFSGSILMFLPAVLGLVVFIPYYLYKFPKINILNKTILVWIITGALILSGAALNIYDRLLYGAVVDYIPLGDTFYLNVSDLYILIGTILFAELLFFSKANERENTKI